MRGLPEDLFAAAQAWAERTATAQGLPARVEDALVLGEIAALVRASRSVAPNRMQASRVEAVVAAPGRSHDDVVEDAGDDGALAR